MYLREEVNCTSVGINDMRNINLINIHYCKLLVAKLYISMLGKRLATIRLQTVENKSVEEVRGDLRDRKSRVRYDERRTPVPEGDVVIW